MAGKRGHSVERHFAAAVKLAQRFPGFEVSTSYGTPAMKVKGKFKAVRDWDAQHGSAAPALPPARKRRTLKKRASSR